MITSLIAFLKKILPDEGILCGFILPDKRHIWAHTHEELANELLRLDSLNYTIYHACASFKEKESRKRDNIKFVKSFWLDIDAGSKKPYDSIKSALEACKTFCKKTKMPEPIYVSSGSGLHLYWPLKEKITVEPFISGAIKLKKLCKEFGLEADGSRTCDPSSILRPIGTHNRKDPNNPKIVGWSGEVCDYDLSEFPFSSVSSRKSKWDNLVSKIESDPYDLNLVADQCLQMRIFRDEKGVMSEPEWKACLGIMAFGKNGDQLSHEWSVGDERYSPQETQSKVDACKNLTGPTTCEYFSSLNDKCNQCPMKGQLTSPAELGRGVPKITKNQLYFSEELKKEEPIPDIGLFTHVGGCLVLRSETKQGKETYIRITQHPVIIETVTRGEMNDDSYSIQIRYKKPRSEWKTTSIALRTLFGASGIAELMGKGIVIHNGDLFKQYVRDSMDYLDSQLDARIQYDQFGWKDDNTSFLVGSRLYTSDKIIEVTGNNWIKQRSKGLGPQKGGSLDKWKENINMLFASGFEAQGFAVLASLSAPFMKLQSYSEGGSILSLISREGGKGKSTALTAAASVWGRLETMKQTNTDTRVARGISTGIMGNLPIIRDEYTQRDPEILKEEIQIFTEGRDKQRGTSEGGLINLGPSWQTLMIAGSNTSLIDTLRAARNGDAMSCRVIEFVVDIPKNTAHWKGDELKNNIDSNAGYAGEEFLKAILQESLLDYIKKLIPSVREDIIKKHSLTSDKRFIARTLAGVAVAGHIVRHLGLIDMSIDRIMAWAQDSLFGKDGIWYKKEREEPSQMLARFLGDSIDNTLIMPGPFKPKHNMIPLKIPSRKLIIRHEISSHRLFIETKSLRAWMQKEEQPWRDLMNDLSDSGLLINSDKMVTLAAGTNMATGRVSCIEIRANHPILTGIIADTDIKDLAG